LAVSFSCRAQRFRCGTTKLDLLDQNDERTLVMTDWFERLTGFSETDYATTQSQLVVDGDTLTSKVNE
jgi:hypothetical protein